MRVNFGYVFVAAGFLVFFAMWGALLHWSIRSDLRKHDPVRAYRPCRMTVTSPPVFVCRNQHSYVKQGNEWVDLGKVTEMAPTPHG